MEKPVRSAASVLAAALLVAACSSNDTPYAYESMRHPTAAEQLFGTTGGELSAAPPSSVATVTEPAIVAPTTAAPTAAPGAAPGAPLTVPQTVSRMAPSDATFAQQALSSSAVEIELARTAYIRAQSPDVRDFARQMLTDHRDMVIKLDNFALERGYLMSWRIEPEKAGTIERLRSLDSASFDRAYMDEMVAAHEKAVATMEIQAASGRETASIASAALPTVRHHLEMARALDAQL
jgi:putative membrane protein